MAVLVTGGAGYIGSHMVWTLLDAGEEVVVLDRLSTGFRSAVAADAKFYIGDVGDPTILARIRAENDIDAILHFAGSVVVPDSVSDPLAYYENNTGNTRNLIAFAVCSGIRRLVFSSTAAIYGRQQTDAPLREDATPNPESPYGMSKLMAEIMLRHAADAHGLQYAALRYFNVAGADERGRTGQSTAGATHLIKVACEAALGRRRRIDIFGTDYPTRDGTAIRDYIHVSDLTDIHMKALDYLRGGGERLVANCGYGRGYSVQEVLQSVMRVHGQKFETVRAARRPGDAASAVADSSLVRELLGWQPQHDDLDHIVKTALAWESRRTNRPTGTIRTIKQRLAEARF